MLQSTLGMGTVTYDGDQYRHSGTTATGNSSCGNIEISPGENFRGDSGGDIHLRELQTQRDDGHGRKAGNGVGFGVDAHEEAGQKGQVKNV
jgi:hypothetical protein